MPLSTKQMEYLALAWQCFDAEPKIDYEKFKDIAGLASAASAREIMRMTKKKLKEEYGALSGGLKIANGGGGGTGGGMDSPVKMKKKMVCVSSCFFRVLPPPGLLLDDENFIFIALSHKYRLQQAEPSVAVHLLQLQLQLQLQQPRKPKLARPTLAILTRMSMSMRTTMKL